MRKNISSGYDYEDAYGYSRAVRVGDMVFVSGTTARAPHLSGDAYVQARAALATIEAALEDAGASMADVVRTVAYVIDITDLPQVARAHSEAFGAIRPASTLVQVSGLSPAAARVEFEVTAVAAAT